LKIELTDPELKLDATFSSKRQSSRVLVVSAGSCCGEGRRDVEHLVLRQRSIGGAVAAAKCVPMSRPSSGRHADDEGFFFVLFGGGGLRIAGLLLLGLGIVGVDIAVVAKDGWKEGGRKEVYYFFYFRCSANDNNII